MSQSDPSPTLEELSMEIQGFGRYATFDDLPPAPGEPLFTHARLVDLVALSAIVLDDGPGPCGNDIRYGARKTVGKDISPGTVYPALERLHDEGVLAQKDLVQTKRYVVGDPALADQHLARYERRLRWLLRLCLTARAELFDDVDDTEHDA